MGSDNDLVFKADGKEIGRLSGNGPYGKLGPMRVTREEYNEFVIALNKSHPADCVGGITANGIMFSRDPESGMLEPLGGYRNNE